MKDEYPPPPPPHLLDAVETGVNACLFWGVSVLLVTFKFMSLFISGR